MKQITDTVLMISPSQFGFNDQTAETNSFQNKSLAIGATEIQNLALKEFQTFVETLKANGINIIEFQDFQPSLSPDSIFPNNWFSTHSNGTLISYPMLAKNRRLERRKDILDQLRESYGFDHISLEHLEKNVPPKILEGTGSMVLDRNNRVVYAVNSSRTDKLALEEFAKIMAYTICSFDAFGLDGKSIYHSNVLMSMGEDFVIIGMDNIASEDKNLLLESFQKTKKALIPLKDFQVNLCFAGNMLQLRNKDMERILVMSQSAFSSLDPLQINELMKYNEKLLPINIPTIELYGGGSVRCMMAEIFVKKRG